MMLESDLFREAGGNLSLHLSYFPLFPIDSLLITADIASDRPSGVQLIATSDAAISLQPRKMAASFTVCTVAWG